MEKLLIDERIYGPAIMVCLSALGGYALFKGFRSGTMKWSYFGLSVSGNRLAEPGKFWAATALQVIVFCLGFIGSVSMVIWPHGIGR
jgi:hypothetical protein